MPLTAPPALKTCHCGTRFSHPTSADCSFCGGRVCACGKAKTLEAPTCGRVECRRRASRAANVNRRAVAAKVLPIRQRGTTK